MVQINFQKNCEDMYGLFFGSFYVFDTFWVQYFIIHKSNGTKVQLYAFSVKNVITQKKIRDLYILLGDPGWMREFIVTFAQMSACYSWQGSQ